MRDKRKTLDKKIDNVKLKEIAKKQKIQERGITLIALVVTIIILLILAGVTLNIALSDNGLFSKAKKAAEEYEQAQSEEEDLINKFATQMNSEYVGAEVIGYDLSDINETVTIDGITSGLGESNKDETGANISGVNDDGSQEFTTDTDMKWRVWDFDGNTLRIIGEPTSQTLTLRGAAGYNNGVWAIDNICNTLYSNGKEGVSAKNLKRTDIQKVSTYDYTKFKHEPGNWGEDLTTGNNNSIYFGATKTYESSNKYPKMWEENDKDWTYEYKNGTATGGDKECNTWEVIGTEDGQMEAEMKEGSKEITFKQSYYYHTYKQNEFINDKYYDLIFKKTDGSYTGNYWLAGRSLGLDEDKCSFGIQGIVGYREDDHVTDATLCFSNRCHKISL